MATGIPFPEANTILRAPTPEDAAAGTVYDLHVHRYTDLDGNPQIISKWQFEPEELARIIAAGGVFWFHAWGHTHPPVGISGDNPFVRAKWSGERATHDRGADEAPARWAFERVEEERARALGSVPNPANIDVWLANPPGWRAYHVFAAYIERHECENAELLRDKARLDYLDRCNAALNAHYGTAYSWRLIQSHNVNRLMLGNYYDVDLNDSQPHGLPSCRDAIDERMRDAGRAAA